jgi:hypothetical protein
VAGAAALNAKTILDGNEEHVDAGMQLDAELFRGQQRIKD